MPIYGRKTSSRLSIYPSTLRVPIYGRKTSSRLSIYASTRCMPIYGRKTSSRLSIYASTLRMPIYGCKTSSRLSIYPLFICPFMGVKHQVGYLSIHCSYAHINEPFTKDHRPLLRLACVGFWSGLSSAVPLYHVPCIPRVPGSLAGFH